MSGPDLEGRAHATSAAAHCVCMPAASQAALWRIMRIMKGDPLPLATSAACLLF